MYNCKYFCKQRGVIVFVLNFSEWHSDSQDPQVYDKPAASEEANGKDFTTMKVFICEYDLNLIP